MKKYDDPGNLAVTTFINNIPITNILIVLGATINVITTITMGQLHVPNLQQLPRELVDRSKVHPIRNLEDIIVSMDSWE